MEAVQQMDMVKVDWSGRQRGLSLSIKSGVNCKSLLFCSFFCRKIIWCKLSVTPLFHLESHVAIFLIFFRGGGLHVAKCFCCHMQPSSVASTLHPPSETGTHTFIFNHLDFYHLHLAVPLYGYTLSIQPFSRVLGERAPRTKSMSFGFLLLILSPINMVHLCLFAVAVQLKNICDEKHNSTQTILESMTTKCNVIRQSMLLVKNRDFTLF